MDFPDATNSLAPSIQHFSTSRVKDGEGNGGQMGDSHLLWAGGFQLDAKGKDSFLADRKVLETDTFGKPRGKDLLGALRESNGNLQK
jgi:hypothetical protein